MYGRKVIFIELDAGTWEVIDPLMRDGKLPNLKRLMENGASGELISDHPFISAKLWTSIFTGKIAQKHGVKFFGATSENVLCKRIWDIFNSMGLSVGVFGSLVTWPPQSINGFMIPSVFALGPETYPEKYQFFQEIVLGERKRFHHSGHRFETKALLAGLSYAYHLLSNSIGLGTFGRIVNYVLREIVLRYRQGDRYWRKAFLQLRISTDMFVRLYESYAPWFSTFHIHLCDAVSHSYWEFYQPENFPGVDYNLVKKYAKVIPNSYIEADKMIGKILSMRDENTIIIVASDHGSMALTRPPINPYVLNLQTFLAILNIYKQAVPARFGLETFLYFKNHGLKEKTAKVIKDAKFASTGERIFDVRSFDDYVSFKVAQNRWKTTISHDIIIDLGSFGKFRLDELFSQKNMNISGIHKREGILIIEGPHIKVGEHLKNASIFDLTPSILFLMGYPVAKDMDGRIIEEAIDETFLLRNKVEYIDSYEDASTRVPAISDESEDADYDKLKERLQSLGYL
jgi:predicted AlkP superfamily phosphohydrolase/phosphomutase